MATILSKASVKIDGEQIAANGNTLSYMDGNPEGTVESFVIGGATEVAFSTDESTRVSEVKFELPASSEWVNKARDIAALGPGRRVEIAGEASDGTYIARVMAQGMVTNKPEVALQNGGSLEMVLNGSPLTAG